MLSFSFILTVIALVLWLVALVSHFSTNHRGLALPLSIAAGICVSVALIIGGVGVWYVQYGTVH